MRLSSPTLLVAILGCALGALALVDCSTSNAGSSPGAQQPLGASCDSTLGANACAPSQALCSVSVCVSGTCAAILSPDAGAICAATGTDDAGAPLPPTGALCATSSDCDGGAVCGFYAIAGCVATGVCVIAATSSSALPPPACGCTGLADPYVANGYTGAPASSAGPCEDGGAEAGGDASAGADADAGADASADAGADADADAGADAGGDASDGAPE